jgi:membrane-bound ClpP family serine protease
MNNFPLLSLAGAALIVCALLALTLTNSPIEGLLMFGLGTGFLMADAKLSVTKTLPGAASTTVNSTGIDLETGTRSDLRRHERSAR